MDRFYFIIIYLFFIIIFFLWVDGQNLENMKVRINFYNYSKLYLYQSGQVFKALILIMITTIIIGLNLRLDI